MTLVLYYSIFYNTSYAPRSHSRKSFFIEFSCVDNLFGVNVYPKLISIVLFFSIFPSLKRVFCVYRNQKSFLLQRNIANRAFSSIACLSVFYSPQPSYLGNPTQSSLGCQTFQIPTRSDCQRVLLCHRWSPIHRRTVSNEPVIEKPYAVKSWPCLQQSIGAFMSW